MPGNHDEVAFAAWPFQVGPNIHDGRLVNVTNTNYTIGPQLQRGDGVAEVWTNRRSMQGSVYARFSDIAVAGNANFHWVSAEGWVDLLDDNGVGYGSATLPKTWGVLPGYAYIGYVGSTRAIHLETAMWCVTGYDSYGGEIWSAVNWTMQLYCDNLV